MSSHSQEDARRLREIADTLLGWSSAWNVEAGLSIRTIAARLEAAPAPPPEIEHALELLEGATGALSRDALVGMAQNVAAWARSAAPAPLAVPEEPEHHDPQSSQPLED